MASKPFLWRQVLGFGLVFVPGAAILTFYLVDDSVSNLLVAAILCGCCAAGVLAGLVFRRRFMGKPLSGVAKGSASATAGSALILSAMFDGPVFVLILAALVVTGGSYIATSAALELQHPGSQGEAASAGDQAL